MFNFIQRFKLPAIKVNKNKATNEYLKNIFITEEQQGVSWKIKCLNAFFDSNIEKLEELCKGKTVNFETHFLDLLLNYFGSNELENCNNLISILNSSEFTTVKKAKIENDKLIVETKEETITAIRFTDFPSKELVNLFPDLTKRYNREKQCHNFSIKLTLNSDFDCKLSTGYISSFSPSAKYLHSWVETKFNHQNFVFDLTKNIIINKNGYYLINNINGPVYKINKDTFIKEKDTFNDIARTNKYLSKLYLANRPLALALYEKYKEKRKKQEEDNQNNQF